MQPLFLSARKISCLIFAWSLLQSPTSIAQIPTGFDYQNFSLVEAVRYTVANQTNIKIEQTQVEITRGAYQSASGEFDVNLVTQLGTEEDDDPFSEPDAAETGIAHQQTKAYSLNQSASKTFRYGTSLDSSIGVARNEYQYPENTPATVNPTFSFTLTQPLLRGRGTEATGANELSKQELYRAEQYTLQQTISKKILDTATAYWNYRGAADRVETIEKSIKNVEKSIRQLEKLIAGNEKPASDLNHYLANLANRKIQLLSAQQQRFSASQALAVAMGIPYDQKANLPPAKEEFPSPDVFSLTPTPQWLNDQALANRNDLKSVEKDLAAAKYLLGGAESNMLSQLDLALKFKYSDVQKGTYDEDSTSISALLNYEFPVGNNIAGGRMVSARANVNQIRYQIEGLKRSITSEVNDAVDTLTAYYNIEQQYEATLDLNKERVKNERVKYTLGTSNLVIVIDVEDSLTETQLGLIESRTNVAKALIRLRHVTGTILETGDSTITVDQDRLTTVPDKI